jgi:hypothetical protein
MRLSIIFALLILVGIAIPGFAQSDRPAPAAEIYAGHAGFLDDSNIPHTVLGGAGRFYFTQRLAVGPEFAYMWGPGSDRDSFLTGNLTVDLLKDSRSNPRAMIPFVVGGFGLMKHSEGFGSHTVEFFTAGGGTRIRINDRLYGLVDFRIGWEPHYRITGGIGVRLSK